jgi:ketosteroid isomerase-like protein
MSENLDLVRPIYADWERGDFRRTDWADPEFEMTSPDSVEGGVVKGLESAGRTWRAWLNSWQDYRAEASEVRVIDHERVLVLGRMSGQGRLSEAGGEAETVNLFHIRDGKVVRLVLYHDRDRALADLGLKE